MMDKTWLDCYAFFVLIIKATPLSFINESLKREREREILGKKIKLRLGPIFLALKTAKIFKFSIYCRRNAIEKGFSVFLIIFVYAKYVQLG